MSLFGRRPRAQRALLLPLLIPAACIALYGCPSEDTTEDDDGALPAGYEDVLFEGGTTDEALVAFAAALDQGAPQPDTSQAPILSSPVAGELPSDPVPTFTWKLGSSASAAAPGDMRWATGWSTDRSRSPFAAADALQVALSPLAELVGPPRGAHAHGDPFNGYGVLLTIKSSSDPKLCRVFTGATSYTPAADVWEKIAAAGEVTVELVGAAFESNRIPEGSGPYLGSTTALTITAP